MVSQEIMGFVFFMFFISIRFTIFSCNSIAREQGIYGLSRPTNLFLPVKKPIAFCIFFVTLSADFKNEM